MMGGVIGKNIRLSWIKLELETYQLAFKYTIHLLCRTAFWFAVH